jgi:threonine dehydrogenase-like Zn-dependent dehydrogenase
VIESVGTARLYALAFELIRKGGHVAFFGLTPAGEELPVDILRTVLEENSLKGSVAGMGEDMQDALTLLAHGRFQTAAFTQASFPLDQIQDAFESLAARPLDLKTQIVLY